VCVTARERANVVEEEPLTLFSSLSFSRSASVLGRIHPDPASATEKDYSPTRWLHVAEWEVEEVYEVVFFIHESPLTRFVVISLSMSAIA